MVVMGAGTGGTLTGIARKVKEQCPNCKVICHITLKKTFKYGPNCKAVNPERQGKTVVLS